MVQSILYKIATHCKHIELWLLTSAGIAFFELRSPSRVLHNCLQSIISASPFAAARFKGVSPSLFGRSTTALVSCWFALFLPVLTTWLTVNIMKPKMFVHAVKALLMTCRIKSNTNRTSGFLKLHASPQKPGPLPTFWLLINPTTARLLRSKRTLCCKEAPSQCYGLKGNVGTAWKTNVKNDKRRQQIPMVLPAERRPFCTAHSSGVSPS